MINLDMLTAIGDPVPSDCWGRIVKDVTTGMTMAVRVCARIGCLTLLLAASPLRAAGEAPPRRVDITIGPDTTVIDGPVRPDGTIDYAAALRARVTEGVTPENNAATLLLKALGAAFVPEEKVDEALRLTGLAAMSDEGAVFQPFGEYVAEHTDLSEDRQARDQMDQALAGPWTAADLPLVAGWLAANEKPLELVVEASKRPRYFFLFFPSGDRVLMETLLGGMGVLRDAAKALACRAMLRLQEGDIDGAGADLMALHRLGRVMAARSAVGIEYLMGMAIDCIALLGDQHMATSGRLTPAQARRHLQALGGLAAFPDAREWIGVGERFCALSTVMAMTDPVLFPRASAMSDMGFGDVPQRLHRILLTTGVDWDLVLREVNRQHDRTLAIVAMDDPAAREEAAKKQEEDLYRRCHHGFKEVLPAFLQQAAESRADRTALRRQATEIMTAFALVEVGALGRVRNLQDEAAVMYQLTLLALHLEIGRAEHGRYPQRLESLVGRYVESLPLDPFSGKGLVYRREGEGYVVYSIGPNLRDDGGRRRDEGEDCDDVVVRAVVPTRTE
ncbi:MAG: hypothetical protein GX591_18620 [Planctomycetes bacterium]|nr:hypothetical protein [Planctomycetota bacterium]